MDKATLVKGDSEIERTVTYVTRALADKGIPVTLVDLNYVPEIEEWQLVVATPWYDSKGPREAYSQIIGELQNLGFYKDTRIRKVSVLSPNDSQAKILEREVKVRTEGTIHITRRGQNRQDHEKLYFVIFTPYIGSPGALPNSRIAGLGKLREFLEERLYIERSSVDGALAELARKGNTSIPRVQLTRKEAKRLGLA